MSWRTSKFLHSYWIGLELAHLPLRESKFRTAIARSWFTYNYGFDTRKTGIFPEFSTPDFEAQTFDMFLRFPEFLFRVLQTWKLRRHAGHSRRLKSNSECRKFQVIFRIAGCITAQGYQRTFFATTPPMNDAGPPPWGGGGGYFDS